jgi:hypothetical protein
MRTSGPPIRLKARRIVEQRIVWPLLDLRDFVLRRDRHDKPLYPVHHVPRWVRMKWAVLDFFDGAAEPVKAHRRHHAHEHRDERRIGLARAVQLAVIPVALLAGLAVALIGSGGSSGSPAAATVPPPKPPAQVQVAGVSDSSAERRERRAARRERAADHRRALRRKRAAIRRRHAALRRKHAASAAKKRRERAKNAAPASPAPDGTPSTDTPSSGDSQAPPATTPSAPPPASSPPRTPSGGGGGGKPKPPPKQPQPSPGVDFDDTG